MLILAPGITIADSEIEWQAIRAQGAGGQNVNKVSSAVHLRFDIKASSLPNRHKEKLLSLEDQRVNNHGVIVIKAQRYRSLERNRLDAREKLSEMVQRAMKEKKSRRATKIPRSVRKKRLDSKAQRGHLKKMRSQPSQD